MAPKMAACNSKRLTAHFSAVFFLSLVFIPSFTLSASIYYDFTLSYFCGAPDGVRVCHILGVNGQFPGPTIEGRVGDTLHVRVTNAIQGDGSGNPLSPSPQTTIHYHGLFQNGTPFQDGPFMVTQCGIAPSGFSSTYKFELKQTGTYWYHSHVGSQYTEGLWGPLIIHGRAGAGAAPEPYAADIDGGEFTVTLSDWYHTSGVVNTNWFLSPAAEGNEPIPSSHLMNGLGAFPCNVTSLPCSPQTRYPVFNVKRGKKYRVRVINSSAFAKFYFSIPGHVLEVIEVDGVDTVRRTVPGSIAIAAAQRYSFIVHMNAAAGADNHWIVATADMDMYGMDGPNINPNPYATIATVYGKLQYEKPVGMSMSTLRPLPGVQWTFFGATPAPYPPPPSAPPMTTQADDDAFEMSLQPADGLLARAIYDQEVVLVVEQVTDSAGVDHLAFNNIIYDPSAPSEPLITLAMKNGSFPPTSHVIQIEHLQVIQVVINNHDTGPHPFHLHGHAFWVLGKGQDEDGDYDPALHGSQLVLNGVKRDTVTIATQSWIVIRFVADNPGVWFLHCHIHWHLEGGLAMVFSEAPDVLRAQNGGRIPVETKRVCARVGIIV